jgi:mRNA-degrading endonuclease RelE of RelBE toxin-antitoxin system
MRELARTDRFKKLYERLPTSIKKKVKRQMRFLAEDIRHPSLYAKKMSGREGVWEARVDVHHRMTFQIVGDRIILRAVGPHDLLKKP